MRWLHATYKYPPPEHLGLLPKPTKKDAARGSCNVCGGFHGLPAIHLDYLGHAELTDILLYVDPMWSWEPIGTTEDGRPWVTARDGNYSMWVNLTIWGVTRPGVGSCGNKGENIEKELIGDALRNAAMRFGIGVSLWSKIDGVDRRMEAGQDVKADSDHTGAEDQPSADTANTDAAEGEWTVERVKAMTKPAVVELLAVLGLKTNGPEKDLRNRLWAHVRTLAAAPPADDPTPTEPEPTQADTPDEPTPEPTPAPDDAAADESEAQDPEDMDTINEGTIRVVLESIAELKGVTARAYAKYRREEKLPNEVATWTYDQAEAVLKFIDALVPVAG